MGVVTSFNGTAEYDPDVAAMVSMPGPLTLAVMGILWRHQAIPLMRLYRSVCEDYKPVALSTVSTTLTRLIQRGWAKRSRHGYQAGVTRSELIVRITDIIDSV
jgi:predicted transcriptional regulator